MLPLKTHASSAPAATAAPAVTQAAIVDAGTTAHDFAARSPRSFDVLKVSVVKSIHVRGHSRIAEISFCISWRSMLQRRIYLLRESHLRTETTSRT